VALRNIEILQEEKLACRAAEIGAYFLDALQSLKSHKNVGDIRGKGLLIGVELVKDRVWRGPPRSPAGGPPASRVRWLSPSHAFAFPRISLASPFCRARVFRTLGTSAFMASELLVSIR
jgi:Aminotransferase class-III